MADSDKLPNIQTEVKESASGDGKPKTPSRPRSSHKKKYKPPTAKPKNETVKEGDEPTKRAAAASTDTATDSSSKVEKRRTRGGKGRKRNGKPAEAEKPASAASVNPAVKTTEKQKAKKESKVNSEAVNSKSTASSSSKSKDRRQKRKAANRKKGSETEAKNVSDVLGALLSSSSAGSRPCLSSTSQSLSAEGIALLADIQKNKPRPETRTGKISMSELMGGSTSNDRRTEHSTSNSRSTSSGGPSVLQRLSGNMVDPETILSDALRRMPLVPGFPSLTHRPDSGPFSSAFRPELFKTTMEAYASAAMQCGVDLNHAGGGGVRSSASRSSIRSGRNSASPDQLLPWINFAPMFPLEHSASRTHAAYNTTRSHSMSGSSTPHAGHSGYSRRPNNGVPHQMGHPQQHQQHGQNGFRSPYQNHGSPAHRPNSTSGGFGGNSSPAPHHQGSNHQLSSNQKTRKPYFMPYLSNEAASRGLSNGDLIKGSLRVNQRNYEESYVDNPEGDDQLDLLILGVHDRNRALHGDVVVVRIKERINWVVRENLYQAWRAGHLNASRDDNGQPLTIPPLEIKRDDMVEVAIGGVPDLKIPKRDLTKNIPPSPEGKYARNDMLLLGAQLEVARKQLACAGDSSPSTSACVPAAEVQTMIEKLSIARAADPVLAAPSPRKSVSSQPKRGQQQNGKRTSYRVLADMPDDDWGVPDVCLQKTAEVVFISEAKNCRAAMGQLRPMADNNKNWALFSPTDSRMPRMMIPSDQVPSGFFERPQDFAKFIFVARMIEWQATAQFARGRLERSLGVAGDIEAETEGLLYANNIDTREFSHTALECLPITDSTTWSIHEREFNYRKDLREEIIFTIDPKTARDLDDALHIKKVDDVDGKGTEGWEVGVHIADVTHFLIENTELDTWAASRATSVYLVHKVIPMLPRILCEELCSLNPGVDRLTFSVIWKMDNDANILSEWFGRTVIRSKVKLAYEHAQDFIEHPDQEFETEAFPPISDDVSLAVIKEKTLQLDAIARKLRAGRMGGGALRLDQPKLKFSFDDETKLPNGVSVYEIKDSNRLVEEFMLLANMAVARKIEGAFPETSILRRHPPPKQKVLREVLEVCEKIGFPLNGSSSGLLSSSLHKFQGDTQLMKSINQVLSMLMMKPMQLAQYFCTGAVKSKEMYAHYALNTPFYTHFTSPIRRYPDVMVHRLLAAALGYCPPPEKTVHEVEVQAGHCNDKKTAAKAVSEASDDTFFGLFVKQCGPLEERGVVVNVLDASFDVLVFKYGVIKRVYVNRLDMTREAVFREAPPPTLTLFWNSPDGRNNAAIEQTIQMCTIVDVILTALPEPTKYQAVIRMRPNAETHTLLELLESGKDLA